MAHNFIYTSSKQLGAYKNIETFEYPVTENTGINSEFF